MPTCGKAAAEAATDHISEASSGRKRCRLLSAEETHTARVYHQLSQVLLQLYSTLCATAGTADAEDTEEVRAVLGRSVYARSIHRANDGAQKRMREGEEEAIQDFGEAVRAVLLRQLSCVSRHQHEEQQRRYHGDVGGQRGRLADAMQQRMPDLWAILNADP
ncbi:hypothetical protein DQ04_01511060 [Trypanosoma grayi]|uniref:hypothetical protein n=1 Tax=Trypanosoma grayi TaxID=71804 RepID=UPI0004F45CAE|nr:hypothetical protein DQ04_01511060 [Trypanosoma grayi]KEG12687.1 hypothetical protein DQ04_01511060 [Trypanosoma grayi]